MKQSTKRQITGKLKSRENDNVVLYLKVVVCVIYFSLKKNIDNATRKERVSNVCDDVKTNSVW